MKGHIINANVKSYGIFPSFDPLHQEFTPGNQLSDKFSDCFSFNLVNKKGKENNRAQELDDLVLYNSISSTTLVVTDASIKNDIATSVAHIHQTNISLIKTVHHTVFVTSLEVELFAMRCGINQAYSKDNISKIIIITDSIHTAKLIFDSSSHPLQSHSAAILSELRLFLTKVRTIPSNFGNVQVTLSGGSTKMLTKILNLSTQLLSFRAKRRGTTARKLIVMMLSNNGKCDSKLLMEKETTSWIY